jgi:two-component system alkaline phosphatase synthesis response regulator PhoP
MKPLIYVVEDDMAIQELYMFSLENEFECRCFGDGESFFRTLSKGDKKPALILLDVMLPGEDGFSILSRLKSENSTSQIPVIMVSAKGDEVAKVRGLNMGADDYMAKPFGVMELGARIKANLRRSQKSSKFVIAQNIEYKDILIEPSKHQVTVNSTPIQTTLKEFRLLCLFCENPGKVLERREIYDKVWEEEFFSETRTLDIHIKGVRKKLIEAGSEVMIKTIRGVGHILN